MDETQNKTTEPRAAEKETSEDTRKSYEKPQVIYRAPLEAMASVCTGTGGKSNISCTTQFS